MRIEVESTVQEHPDIEEIVEATKMATDASLEVLEVDDPEMRINIVPMADSFRRGRYLIKQGLIKLMVTEQPYAEQRADYLDTSAHEVLHRVRHLRGIEWPKSLRIGPGSIEEGLAGHFGKITCANLWDEESYQLPLMPPVEAAGYILRNGFRDALSLRWQHGTPLHVIGYNALKLLGDDLSLTEPRTFLAPRSEIRERLGHAMPSYD